MNLIWSCSKIDFTSGKHSIIEMLHDYASYERLIDGLPTMQQKNLVILLWTYTRDDRLAGDENCQHFIEKTLDAMLHF